MKKFCLMFLIALLCMTGCSLSNKETENNSGSNTQNTNQSSSTSKTDDSFLELYGAKFYYPSSFEGRNISGLTGMKVFSGKLNSNDAIYWFVVPDVFYDSDFSVYDTPDILYNYVKKIVDSRFATYDSKYSISVSNESNLIVKDKSFIKRVGIIHTESDKQTSDLNYIAYYGILDYPSYDYYNVPTVWMVFSNSSEQTTLNDMEIIADKTASLLSWD